MSRKRTNDELPWWIYETKDDDTSQQMIPTFRDLSRDISFLEDPTFPDIGS